ncbi:hypothetical protein ACO2JO_18940 [Leptospira interrogans]
MAISKLEAAQRQLNCSIRLYFGEEDILAVHTLSRAAFRILYDLYPTLKADGYSQNVEAMILLIGWKRFNQVSNFLKHALSDPNSTQDLHEMDTQLGIALASMMLYRLTSKTSSEMQAFDIWMKLFHADKFSEPLHPDPKIETRNREALAILNSEPRASQLLLGQSLIRYCAENPE